MATLVPSKYALKSLHEEIALFDRKLAHLQKYETFTSEEDRVAATAKMSLKRTQLVRAAQAMADAGIEFQPTQIPSSLRESSVTAEAPEPALVDAVASSDAEAVKTLQPMHEGSVLDFRNSIAEYKKRRKFIA